MTKITIKMEKPNSENLDNEILKEFLKQIEETLPEGVTAEYV